MARTSRWLPWLSLAAFVLGVGVLADPAFAKTVRIPKTGAKCADDPACHNRWHPAIKPAATADPGDTVEFGTRDAFDHAFTRAPGPGEVGAPPPPQPLAPPHQPGRPRGPRRPRRVRHA